MLCKSCPDEMRAMLGCQRRERPPERLRPSSIVDEEEEEEDGPPPPPPLILPRDEEHCIVDTAALVNLARAEGTNQGQSKKWQHSLHLPPKAWGTIKYRGSMMSAVAY